MSKPFVLVEKKDHVATITFNRPDTRNAVAEHSDCVEFVAALQDANNDPDIRVAILTGAGKAFSAGGNLKGMRDRNGIGPLGSPAETRANYRRGVQTISETLSKVEIATIAAINGHAVGLGLDVAALCDMRIVAREAKLAASFVKIGIAPGDGGAWILQQAIGYARAAEMILTGDTITGEEAFTIGLVNKVVDADQVLPEAQALAARVAANPAKALRLAKRLLREAQHSRLSDVLELSAAFQALAHETADHQEAVKAFLDKREPKFTGE